MSSEELKNRPREDNDNGGEGITYKDILCVHIAGLCHDIGHGPWSHQFDQMFMKRIASERKWTHERMSREIVEKLLTENRAIKELSEKEGLNEDDIEFIKELIDERTEETRKRTGIREVLYGIVSNKTNKIDVDKWDYFARDCYQLGLRSNFDHKRLIKLARAKRVNTDNGLDCKWQICYREKDLWNMYEMFHTRYSLHVRAYQHPVCKLVEIMFTDALVLAEKGGWRCRKTGDMYNWCFSSDENEETDLIKMSDIGTRKPDPDILGAYCSLTDEVFSQILYSPTDGLTEDAKSHADKAKRLLIRLQKRDLYKIILDKILRNAKDVDEKVIMDEICSEDGIERKSLIIQAFSVDFGNKDEDPTDSIAFYYKEGDVIRGSELKDKGEAMPIPRKFSDKRLRIYYVSMGVEDDKEDMEKCRKRCEKWFNSR